MQCANPSYLGLISFSLRGFNSIFILFIMFFFFFFFLFSPFSYLSITFHLYKAPPFSCRLCDYVSEWYAIFLYQHTAKGEETAAEQMKDPFAVPLHNSSVKTFERYGTKKEREKGQDVTAAALPLCILLSRFRFFPFFLSSACLSLAPHIFTNNQLARHWKRASKLKIVQNSRQNNF